MFFQCCVLLCGPLFSTDARRIVKYDHACFFARNFFAPQYIKNCVIVCYLFNIHYLFIINVIVINIIIILFLQLILYNNNTICILYYSYVIVNVGESVEKGGIAYEVFCCQNQNGGAYSFKLAHIGVNTVRV